VETYIAMDNEYFNYNDYEYDSRADYDENYDGDRDRYGGYDSDNELGHLEDYSNLRHYQEPPERWTQLRINGTVVLVSTRGKVKPYGANNSLDVFAVSTEGTQYLGTPYRFVKIGDKNYMIHELVWFAFCGNVSEGFEVRHNSHYVSRYPHKVYSNRLECLTLHPITISKVGYDINEGLSRINLA